jgi:hypothetical protein
LRIVFGQHTLRRMRRLIVVLALTLTTCDRAIDTEQECEAAGGRLVPAPGPPARCESNEEKIGDIPFGIEGAACCRVRLQPSIR